MPERSLADSRRWMDHGTSLVLESLARLGDDELAGPTALEGWTGRHLVAHLAANADALRNLAHWARTGEETPMYSSSEQRNADIEAGAARPAAELRAWAAESARRLGEDLDGLSAEQWARQVRTAQGRLVAATEVPWMRAREVMVHAVDLGGGVTFRDLPEDFLASLVDDIAAKRSAAADGPALTLVPSGGGRSWSVAGTGDPAEVTGPLPALAAYLAGRDGAGVSAGGGPAPTLPRWL